MMGFVGNDGAAAGNGAVEHPADLRLAEACAAGEAVAVAEFREQCLPTIDAAIRGIDRMPDFVDEARQRVFARLLVGAPGQPPRIAAYTGQGPLRRWVRTAATRVALSLKDEGRRREPLEDVADALLDGVSVDPDVRVAKQRYAAELQAALVSGLAALDPRDRTVLRMHVFDRLNIEAIGKVYGVHRSTVARWIAAARARILDGAARHFERVHGVSAASFAELHTVLVSELDLRLSQLAERP
jgi:RNA polymerase sigma-70 factor (ECF subfamily)